MGYNLPVIAPNSDHFGLNGFLGQDVNPAISGSPSTPVFTQGTNSQLPQWSDFSSVLGNGTSTVAETPTTVNPTVGPIGTASAQVNAAGGSSTSGSGSSGSTSLTLLDNVVNNYHQVAYHIQLYTTADGSGSSGNKIVIAESGVTGYNITSFTLRTVVNTTIMPTKCHLTIVEPLGTSFLDGLVTASQRLNVSNYQKAPYYLSITFKGYDESGNPCTNICKNWPNGGIWTYEITFGTIKTHLTAGGSTYDIDAVLTHAAGYEDDHVSRIQRVISPKGATLGDYLDDFIKQQNQSAKTAGGLYNYAIKYENGQLPEPKQFAFTKELAKEVIQHRGYGESDKNSTLANLTPGTLITDVITTAIGSTVDGQKYMLASDGSIQPGSAPSATAYRDAGHYRIYPTVDFGSYNSQYHQYSKTITYHVKGSILQGTTINGSETNGDNGQTTIKKIDSYGGCKKKYEFNFTGLNTEVLEFNIDYQCAFSALLPNQNGNNYFNDSVRPGPVYSAPAQTSGSSPSGNSGSVASGLTNTVTSLANSIGLGSVAQSLSSAASTASSFFGAGSTTPSGSSAFTSASGGSTGSNGSNGTTYVEDLLTNDTESSRQLKNSTIQSFNTARQAAGTGLPAQRNNGKSMFGALLDQVNGMYLGQGSLQKIQGMKIKGDPYWLGYDYTKMISTSSSDSAKSTLADYSQGSITFLFHMQYPYNWEEVGSTSFRTNDVYTGLYQLVEVNHTFSNGVFTQVLTAVRVASVTSDDATAVLKASTLQSSSGASGSTTLGSSSNSSLITGGVGSFVNNAGVTSGSIATSLASAFGLKTGG